MKLLSILAFAGLAAAQTTTFHFDFSTTKPAPYSDDLGYGVESPPTPLIRRSTSQSASPKRGITG